MKVVARAHHLWTAALLLVTLLASPVVSQQKGGVDLHGSYDVVAGWMKPYAGAENLVSPVTVFAESADRIFIGSLGITPKASAPPTLTTFDPKDVEGKVVIVGSDAAALFDL